MKDTKIYSQFTRGHGKFYEDLVFGGLLIVIGP
jgi:hypothetical protein